MTEQTTLSRVTDILVEQLGVNPEQCVPDAHLGNDLGADSLDMIEIVMAFEEELGVDISDETAEKVTTVRELVAAMDVILAAQ